MKHLIASILITGSMLGVIGIIEADVLTGKSVTDAYLSGQLEDRLQELGTNKQTGVFEPLWRKRQEDGVRLHCTRTLLARGAKSAEKCGTKTSIRL